MIDKGPEFQFGVDRRRWHHKQIAEPDDSMRLDSINQLDLGCTTRHPILRYNLGKGVLHVGLLRSVTLLDKLIIH